MFTRLPGRSKANRTLEVLNRIMSGYSLGGLFTTYSMIQPNTPFNAFLAMSPSYWTDDYSAIDTITKFIKGSKQPAPLFLSVANEKGMGVEKLRKKLSQLKPTNWQFKHYPNENHFSTALPAIQDGLAFLFKGYYLDSYQLSDHQDYQAVLAAFFKNKQLYNGFNIEWLQAYKFSRYIFSSKQTAHINDILVQVKQQLPDSLIMITNYLAKGLNATKQYQKAQQIIDTTKSIGGDKVALWHHQYSLAMKGLNKPQLAKLHQDKAMSLAKKYQLPMWQIWEMQ